MLQIPPHPLIKICGLSTIQTIDAASAAGADMLGLVFFAKSPRHLEHQAAAALAIHSRTLQSQAAPSSSTPPTNLPPPARFPKPALVGLFVNPDDETLQSTLEQVPLDFIQLHGSESTMRIAQIKARTGLPVIKALGVRTQDDVTAAHLYKDVADMILFDAKPPATATRPGGLGSRFDWDILTAYDGTSPFLLSGGLTPDTIAEALLVAKNIRGFCGLDVSSGVETIPGEKDIGLIGRFITRARDAMSSA